MSRKLAFALSLFVLLSSLTYARFNPVNVKAPNGYPVHNIDTGLNYTTIQNAIDAPETENGHTIFVEGGIYYEHIIVNKTVLLIGENRGTTTLDGDGTGTVVLVQSCAVVSGFTIRDGYIGVALVSSNSSRIDNNVIRDNKQGIYLSCSSSCNISQNFITSNYHAGIVLNNSKTNIIDENVVSYSHLYAFFEAVFLYNSSCNNIIMNTIINNQADGIRLNDYSFHNIVSSNLLIDNLGGIKLVKSCDYNIIKLNTIGVNETAFGLTSGIWVRESRHNTVYANVIMSNRTSPAYKPPYQDGIGLSKSSNNSIIKNEISLMDVGIGFHFSDNDNRVIDNVITRNGHGIDFSEGRSNGNFIYSNDFVDNVKQVYNKVSTNTWDNGHIVGGNYWSDYKERYPNATEIDGSGIWDTPYEIDQDNVDRYPIVPEFPSFLILPLFMMATLLSVIVYKRKHTARKMRPSFI
jgi:parallel beta-helix repeat protein